MRKLLMIFTIASFITMGCSPEPIVTVPAESPLAAPPAPAQPNSVDDPESSSSAEKARREAKEAWDAAAEFAAESKEEFVAEAKRRLALMDAKLEEWKQRASSMSSEEKSKWEPERIELQQRRDELQRELDRPGSASAAAWEDLKVGASKAWKETSEAFRKAATHFE